MPVIWSDMRGRRAFRSAVAGSVIVCKMKQKFQIENASWKVAVSDSLRTSSRVVLMIPMNDTFQDTEQVGPVCVQCCGCHVTTNGIHTCHSYQLPRYAVGDLIFVCCGLCVSWPQWCISWLQLSTLKTQSKVILCVCCAVGVSWLFPGYSCQLQRHGAKSSNVYSVSWYFPGYNDFCPGRSCRLQRHVVKDLSVCDSVDVSSPQMISLPMTAHNLQDMVPNLSFACVAMWVSSDQPGILAEGSYKRWKQNLRWFLVSAGW